MTAIPENLALGDEAELLAAESWAGKRKPHDLCIELAVRVMQLTGIVMRSLQSLKLAMDGTTNGPPFPAELLPMLDAAAVAAQTPQI